MTSPRAKKPRSFLAPEVVQTSAMDCGPACLKSAFAGFGIDVGYDALRDACQTDVDGTSLDALERVANQLGLVAEQIWVPVDHLTMPEISPLPAVIVAQQPGGTAHFLLAWRQTYGMFQVMDPAMGRRWVNATDLAGLNFPYEIDIDGTVWREWATTAEFAHAMGRRLAAVSGDEALFQQAADDASSHSLASLDAATRMVASLIGSGAVARGAESRALHRSLYAQAVVDLAEGASGRTIPETFFSALPQPGDMIRLRGAIILRFRGRAEKHAEADPEDDDEPRLKAHTAARVTKTQKARPWLEALRVLRREGAFSPAMILAATGIAAMLAFLEVMMLRALLDIGTRLQGTSQRLAGFALLVGFLVLATVFEAWSVLGVRGLGRRFELRLRVDFLSKVPLLGDVYFRSRPASDMAHRAHAFHPVRTVPLIVGRIVRLLATLVVTLVGLVWLDPRGWKPVVGAALVCLVVPWIAQGILTESDLKVRTHDGRLAQFNLDALLGLMPIRAHGAERAVRWEHAAIVFEWVKACKERLRRTITVEAIQTIATTLLSIAVVTSYVRRSTEPGAVLLLAYWILGLPQLGQEMALLARQLPRQKNLLGRLLEPILSDAIERSATTEALKAAIDEPQNRARPHSAPDLGPKLLAVDAPTLRFEGVSVTAGGRKILEGVSLEVSAGEHVAVVGPSGAGKSTLLGVLLGFSNLDGGSVTVDGRALDFGEVRRRAAWVDPAVSLWGASLIDNVRFGSEEATDQAVAPILEQAELLEVLERMPDGLQTNLGESGRLVSGGEGQRVRLARAMMRATAGLVLLDEPFRGLERPMRESLMARAREWWTRSTMLCVTHDVGSALDFDRVVVVEGGAIVECGPPKDLLAAGSGRFFELHEAERLLLEQRWNDPSFRRLRVDEGVVHEQAREAG